MNTLEGQALSEAVKEAAHDVGFALVGIGTVGRALHADRYLSWVQRGRHLPVSELAEDVDVRLDPARRYPWARSVVALGQSYGDGGVPEDPDDDGTRERATLPPMPACEMTDVDAWRRRDPARKREAGEVLARSPGLAVSHWIGRYDRDANYHRVNDGKLERFARSLSPLVGRPVRTQEVIEHRTFLERDLAVRAGLGFWGKNNLVIHPEAGSYFVISSLFTDLQLAPDELVPDGCRSCRACIAACPTDALEAPWDIKLNRCISHLTVTVTGPLDDEVAEKVAGHFSGCDICQDVCPYNHPSLVVLPPPPPRWHSATLFDLLTCDEADRQLLFAGSLVARLPLETVHRNALLVAGWILQAASRPGDGNAGRGNYGGDRLQAADQVDAVDLERLRHLVFASLSSPEAAEASAARQAWKMFEGGERPNGATAPTRQPQGNR